ncbi:MAG TPA: hypothetical protein VKE74_08705, partial [Gemmataceae bacterium]|nr:hypothetical protein [Gemmataceae bacterium]
MRIACPLCQAVLSVKGVKPGKYQPNCPKCGRGLLVVVPDDPSGTVSVQPDPAARSGTAPLPKTTPIRKSGPQPVPLAGRPSPAPQPAPAPRPDSDPNADLTDLEAPAVGD